MNAAYLQAIASGARVQIAKAELASAEELDRQAGDKLKSEVSPEIDSLRARMELQTTQQRSIDRNESAEKRQTNADAHHRFGR
jgi:outer membrane protein TolC